MSNQIERNVYLKAILSWLAKGGALKRAICCTIQACKQNVISKAWWHKRPEKSQGRNDKFYHHTRIIFNCEIKNILRRKKKPQRRKYSQVLESQRDPLQENRVYAQQRHKQSRKPAQMLGALKILQKYAREGFFVVAGKSENSQDGYPLSKYYPCLPKLEDHKTLGPLPTDSLIVSPLHEHCAHFQMPKFSPLSSSSVVYLLLPLPLEATPLGQFQEQVDLQEQIFQSSSHVQRI